MTLDILMKRSIAVGFLAISWLVSWQAALATAPTAGEMSEARRFVAAKFEGVRDSQEPAAGLYVLANHDPVQLNSRGHRPLQIGEKQYGRGLYCHATSKVLVRLPAGGKTFTATAGVDSNENTRPGHGSVVFSVTVGGKSLFHSDVQREGMPAVPVRVDLAGATEFALEVGDGGDGISCDQADWADARVTLADGQTVWLGEMPIVTAPSTYTTEPFFSFTYGGKPSAELLKAWELKRASRRLDAQRMERTLTYSDPKTGLVVRCVGIEYGDFPTVEWTLGFKNTSDKDSPILADIQALDTQLERAAAAKEPEMEFRLHHHVGSPCVRTTTGRWRPC